jgi:hypothetical protein
MIWSCVCAQGPTPNNTQVTFPVPFYACQENEQECAAKCNDDNACLSSCETQFKCGNLTATPKLNSSSPAAVAANSSSIFDNAANGIAEGTHLFSLLTTAGIVGFLVSL